MATTLRPRTLAAFAGLSQLPSHPSRAVLLLTDAQLEYATGKVPLADRFSIEIQDTAALSRCAVEDGLQAVQYLSLQYLP